MKSTNQKAPIFVFQETRLHNGCRRTQHKQNNNTAISKLTFCSIELNILDWVSPPADFGRKVFFGLMEMAKFGRGRIETHFLRWKSLWGMTFCATPPIKMTLHGLVLLSLWKYSCNPPAFAFDTASGNTTAFMHKAKCV